MLILWSTTAMWISDQMWPVLTPNPPFSSKIKSNLKHARNVYRFTLRPGTSNLHRYSFLLTHTNPPHGLQRPYWWHSHSFAVRPLGHDFASVCGTELGLERPCFSRDSHTFWGDHLRSLLFNQIYYMYTNRPLLELMIKWGTRSRTVGLLILLKHILPVIDMNHKVGIGINLTPNGRPLCLWRERRRNSSHGLLPDGFPVLFTDWSFKRTTNTSSTPI